MVCSPTSREPLQSPANPSLKTEYQWQVNELTYMFYPIGGARFALKVPGSNGEDPVPRHQWWRQAKLHEPGAPEAVEIFRLIQRIIRT